MSQAPSGYNDAEFLGTVRKMRHRLNEMFVQSSGYALATFAIAGGYGANLIFQMLYFVILTRMLGAEMFGLFAASSAIINLASPLAGMGFSEVVLVRVSEDKDRTLYWAANALAVTTIIGLVVTVGITIIAGALASEQFLGWHIVLGLALSELVFVSGCRVMARVHQARQESIRYSLINGSIGATKAIVALYLFQTGQFETRQGSLIALVVLFNLCYFPLLALLFVSLKRRSRTPSISWSETKALLGWQSIKGQLNLAISFVTDLTCQTLYTNLDKLLLAYWSTAYVVGTYSAGYRLLIVSAMPMRAVAQATFPRQVKLARNDRKACRRFTINMLSLNVALSVAIAGLIYLLAPLTPIVLGDDFRDSVGVMQWGALLPIAQGCNFTLGKYLTATNRQTVRAKLQLIVTATFVIMGLITIPIYSWKGAVLTGLACESLLAVLFSLGCMVNPQIETTEEAGHYG